MNMDRHCPWCGWLLFFFPITAVLSTYLLPIPLPGFYLYPYRMLIIVALLVPFFLMRISWWHALPAQLYVLLGLFWLSWGVLSLFWTPDVEAAWREMVHVGLGFAAGVGLLNLAADSPAGLCALRWGWVGAYAVTAAIALWELATGQHLPGDFAASAPPEVLRRVVMSTFVNPNNYGAFLLLAFPLLLWAYQEARRPLHRWGLALLLLGLPCLLILTASRLALLGILVQVAVFAVLMGWRRPLRMRYAVMALAVLGIGLSWAAQTNALLIHKLLSLLEGEVASGGSLAVRINLTLNGLYLLWQSGGFGVGAGGFEWMMEQGLAPYPTRQFVNPHNFWIEIASQYGAFVLVLFVLWLLVIGIMAWRILQGANWRILTPHHRMAVVVIVGLVGYVFAALAPSSYMGQLTNWLFLGTLLAMAVHLTAWTTVPVLAQEGGETVDATRHHLSPSVADS
ncbi:MAG TPA: O-antigen ligase family protein [Calditerricola sp.]